MRQETYMNNDLQSNLDQLLTSLNEATVIFKRETPDFELEPDAKHWQREGAAQAIEAVLDFLKPYSSKDTRSPLLEVLGLLGDIDEGRNNQLLVRPPRPVGSPQKSNSNSAKVALAAVTVSLMMDNKIKKQDALKKVAPLIGLNPSELSSSRANFAAGRGDKKAVEYYGRWYPKWKNGPDLDIRIAANLKILQ
jgi:hypothetical protein